MKASFDTSGPNWTITITYDPSTDRRRAMMFAARILGDAREPDLVPYSEKIFERSEPLPVLHDGRLFALTREELDDGRCSRCDKMLGEHRAVITYALSSPRTWSVRLLCKSIDDELRRELEQLRRVVSSRVMHDIAQRRILVTYNREQGTYQLAAGGRWHSWHRTPEEVDAAVVSLLGISEAERRAIEDRMFRDVIGMPVVVDGAGNATAVPPQGDTPATG